MTTILAKIQARFAQEQYEFSRHATDRLILREIRVQEVREAIRSAEMIEDYPEDKYGPSCLLLGFTQMQRPLHIQCTYPTRERIKVITVYEPDSAEWIDFRTRRR